VFRLAGRLDANGVAALWPSLEVAWPGATIRPLRIEASGVTYCDGAGIALLVDIQRRARARGTLVQIHGLRDEYRKLLEVFDPADFKDPTEIKPTTIHVPEQIGEAAASVWGDLRKLVVFVGELAAALGYALRRPHRIRWRDAFLVAENAGVPA
jgi:phospholipid/cholesterol/gamma-HCH transport system permease protein